MTLNLGLLLIASVVAIATRRMRLPYGVGLVAAESLLNDGAAAVGFAIVLASRAATVYGLFGSSALKVDLRHQHVLVWGGLRGALGLALALALPDTVGERQAIIRAAFAVVTFSIFIQGLTMSPLVHHLGLVRRSP